MRRRVPAAARSVYTFVRMGLDPDTRDFLQLVSRAAFTNPFGEERDELDTVLSGRRPDDPEVLDALVERLSGRLRGLERLAIRDLPEEEGALVDHGLVFELFHRFAGPMDELIEAQLRGQEGSPGFARDVLRELVTWGFEDRRAERLVGIFFQMRRAWFFIGRGLVGVTPSMRRLRKAVWNAVFTRDIRLYERHLWDRMEDFSTILLGETGTGKGAAAAAIGRSAFIPYDPNRGAFSAPFTEAFVPINLSQFSASLLESELFGHKKGAFTGAIEAHQGVFARCPRYGAIFLDEIGDVAPTVQLKLLRVLQERVYAPVGSHEDRRFEGRVIAATHRDLSEARADGSFRDDFYYRLSSHVVHMPPLRARIAESPAELEILTRSLLGRLVGEESAAELAEPVVAALREHLGEGYRWPGNVRELEQAIRRVLLTGACAPDEARRGDPAGALVEQLRRGELTAEQAVARYCHLLYQQSGTYVEVAKQTGLDRRTVKKHVLTVSGESPDLLS